MVVAQVLFEVSFEVCNKVGGIHTVVSSKADLLQQAYQQYYLIGPYTNSVEFDEQPIPQHLQGVAHTLQQEGIILHYGRWHIAGKPQVLLLEFFGVQSKLNSLKAQLWQSFQVDTLLGGFDVDEPLMLSYAAARCIECFIHEHPQKAVVHSHEWMTGFTNLCLKLNNSPVKTVFTTHATMLGRSYAAHTSQLYERIKDINPTQEAQRLGVVAKHSTEVACAHHSDIFTTVSDITAMECEYLLGKKPDVIVYNGLNMYHFPDFEQIALDHQHSKKALIDITMSHFFPYYTFDTQQTLFFVISGRHEIHNKGIDVALQALKTLDTKGKTVVCLITVPHKTYGIDKEVLENKIFMRTLRRYMQQTIDGMQHKLVHSALQASYEVFDEHQQMSLQKLVKAGRKTGNPPLSTHYVNEDNEMIRLLQSLGFDNSEQQQVKIMYVPIYLTGVDGVIDLDYYQLLQGCHLGLFASYYEPWGYTPLESCALGVPALTTDLAGFGQFVDGKDGVYVVKRLGKTYDEVVTSCAQAMQDFIELHHNERVQKKIAAKQLSELADWNILVKQYLKAHDMAFSK
ncbi:MAG: glycosyltransferase [Candidatus Woesearchaeota archaeon]